MRLSAIASLVGVGCGNSVSLAFVPATTQAEEACSYAPTNWAHMSAGFSAEQGDFGGFCFQQSLALDAGRAPCLVFDFVPSNDGACACDAARARFPVLQAHAVAFQRALDAVAEAGASADCSCELAQLAGADLARCEASYDDGSWQLELDGFCYQDASVSPPIGDPELANACDQHVLLAFAGKPVAQAEETFVMLCGTAPCTLGDGT